jgi:hypothetical protein
MNVALGEGGNREGQEGWRLFGEAQESAKESDHGIRFGVEANSAPPARVDGKK